MLLWQPAVVAPGGFRAVVLDVGQGAAVVIKTENHLLLYDAGPVYGFFALRDYLRVAPEGLRKPKI